MRTVLGIIFIFILNTNAFSQGVLNGVENDDKLPLNSYSEMFLSTGMGSSIGINHLKDISPKTTILVGATYTNFRMSPFGFERYNNFPTSYTNLRAEVRQFVTPKDQRLMAFVYGAVNNAFIQFPASKPMYNLGLEVGGEVRYKIAENLFFHARTSFYRGDGYLNPYSMNPFPRNSNYMDSNNTFR